MDAPMYVVLWDCLNPRAVAVFDDEVQAKAFAAEFKRRLDELMARIGLSNRQRVYVTEAPLNPVADLNDAVLNIGIIRWS